MDEYLYRGFSIIDHGNGGRWEIRRITGTGEGYFNSEHFGEARTFEEAKLKVDRSLVAA